jgi:hypothetical protein
MFLLAGCDEKSVKRGRQPLGENAEFLSSYWKKRGDFIILTEALYFCFYLEKAEKVVESYNKKTSAAPLIIQTYPATLLLASLNLVRQSLKIKGIF